MRAVSFRSVLADNAKSDERRVAQPPFALGVRRVAGVPGAGLVLAMRLVAEERQTGSITLINTAPVTDAQIVAGKFMSAFLMVFAKTALTVYMPLLLFVNGKVSVGHICVGYAGILLYAAAGTAIGLFVAQNTVLFLNRQSPELRFSIPWEQLTVIVLIALGAALLMTVLPARQAARLTPAEALRES